MKKILSLLAAICLLLIVQAFAQTNFYVSPTGNDANSGTSLATPWRTIQHAADSATPGSTVHILAGTYNELIYIHVSGTSGNPITFRNYQQDLVEITGQGFTTAGSALIFIEDCSNIVVQGLTIRSLTCPNAFGVRVRSNPGQLRENITLKNLVVRNIGFTTLASTIPTVNDTAHGIEINGMAINSWDPLLNIIIDSCEVFENINGYGENIIVKGKISYFSVTHCSVHHNTNTGIKAAGGPIISQPWTVSSPGPGLIAENTTYANVSPISNCPGISCDGSTAVDVERNHTYENEIGIAVGTRSAASTYRVSVRNNFVHHNTYTGIQLGGEELPDFGYAYQCQVRNNTFFHNDNSNTHGEMILGRMELGSLFRNLVYPKGDLLYTLLDIAPNLYFSYGNSFYSSSGNVALAHIYHPWTTTDLLTYQTNYYPQEGGSLWMDPLLVDTNRASLNLHLQATSPALNIGTLGEQSIPGEKDYDGDDRANGIVDMGADEYYPYQAVSGPRTDASTLSIYPNPATLSISVDGAHPTKHQLLSIFDVMGTLVHSESIVPASASVDISALPAGIYFVRLGNATGATKRLIKL